MKSSSELGRSCSGEQLHRISPNSVRLLAGLLFLVLCGVDLCLPYVNVSTLLCIPLILLLSQSRRSQHAWFYVATFIAALYLLYFLKYTIIHQQDLGSIVNHRLFNRTFAAIMMALLGVAAQAWHYWQHERSLLTHLDRVEEDEVNATTGIVGCIALGLLITVIDFFAPANLNLPILFAVPLYLVSWLQDRRSIWITAWMLIALTWIGFLVSVNTTDLGMQAYYVVNRSIVSVALLVLAAILTWRLPKRGDSA